MTVTQWCHRMVTTPVTGIGVTNLSPMRTCHPFPTGHAHKAFLWWHCFPKCAQVYPTTTSPAAACKGVRFTRSYCPSNKVMIGTTKTQFPPGTGAVSYSHHKDYTTTGHYDKLLCRPMPRLGSVWAWIDGICTSLQEACHFWQWRHPWGAWSGKGPITWALPTPQRPTLQESVRLLVLQWACLSVPRDWYREQSRWQTSCRNEYLLSDFMHRHSTPQTKRDYLHKSGKPNLLSWQHGHCYCNVGSHQTHAKDCHYT